MNLRNHSDREVVALLGATMPIKVAHAIDEIVTRFRADVDGDVHANCYDDEDLETAIDNRHQELLDDVFGALDQRIKKAEASPRDMVSKALKDLRYALATEFKYHG